MSTKIKNLGWNQSGSNTDYPKDMRRNVLTTSDDRAIVVFGDGNNSGTPSTGGYGNRDNAAKVYLYESTDRTNWTLRATITPGATLDEPNMVMAELFSDNSIGIIYRAAGTWRYRKVTTGTWAVSAEETVVGTVSWTTSGSWQDGDISIGNGDVPMFIGAYKGNTNGDFYGYRTYVRRTSDSTWVQGNTFTSQSSNSLKASTADVSIQSLDGGTSTARPVVIAIGGCSDTTDNGVKLQTALVNESTGAVTSVTLRGTYMTDEVQCSGMSWTNRPRKTYLFRSGTSGEFFMGIMTWRPKTNKKPKAFAFLAGWNGTTYTSKIGPKIVSASVPLYSGQDSLAMSFGADVANFVTRIPPENSPQIELINVVCQVNRADTTFDFSGHFQWNNNADPVDTKFLMGGSSRFYTSKRHGMAYGRRLADNKWELYHHYAVTPRAPAGHTPGQGANVTSSTPVLQMLADLDLKYPQSRLKARWQLANNSGFTTNLRDYTQSDSKLVEVRNTDAVGSVQYISDVLPQLYSLSQAPWWIRSAQVDEFGNQSPYDTSTSFNIEHDPVAVNLNPKDVNVVFTTGDVTFDWTFSDPYVDDSQTAFQLFIVRNDTGAVIHDSTKIISGQSQYTFNLTGFSELELSWWVVLWDEDDNPGPTSEVATFHTVIAPTIGITVPTSGATVVTPMPNVQFGGSVSGGRSIKQFRVSFTQGSTMIFQTAWIAVNQTGTYAISYTPPKNILLNANNYTITAQVRDSFNLENQASIPISTAWTPPANPTPVTADITPYNNENQGYVAVVWDNSDQDADFRSWQVYRKADEIDGTGTVIEEGEVVKIAEEFDTVTNYEFRDYFAPSGHKITYIVTQMSSEFNELIESSGTSVVCFPVSDGYWLIDSTPEESEAGAFRMSIVTDDQYTDEWEEETFTIVGKGRHVDRGTHLGLTGTLTVQLYNTGGTSARQKKRRLEVFKKEVRDVFLRTPFGDTYWVSVGNIGISRIAGVGLQEFATATIPYQEVGVT